MNIVGTGCANCYYCFNGKCTKVETCNGLATGFLEVNNESTTNEIECSNAHYVEHKTAKNVK